MERQTLRQMPRLRLVHGPTPLWRVARLCERFGLDLWIKRDDATGGAEAGNKLRKLEYLLAQARAQGADTIITCGGLQSNHARATTLVAAMLGLRTHLVLWTDEAQATLPATGNMLLERMAGARIQLVRREQFRDREVIMADVAQQLQRGGACPYVIPEGGSNGLGCLGYVQAMQELRTQLDLGLAGGRPFDTIVHACGSGGTAAGLALGAAAFGVAAEVRSMAVCNDARYFNETIGRITRQARELVSDLPEPVPVLVDESAIGGGYGVSNEAQRRFLVEMARAAGLVLDPVYTGKAMYGLAQAIRADGTWVGRRVLFVHTGGLPGLLAAGDELVRDL